jgi:hypothetical protein
MVRDRSSIGESANLLVGPGHFRQNIFAYLRYLFFPIPFTVVWLAIHWCVVLPSIPVVVSHFQVTP